MATAVDSRQRILDVAAELFRSRGYLATSMRDIADAVGIQAGSLYYHFDAKDEILTLVLIHGISVMDEAFTAAHAATAGATPAERLRAHVRAHLAALFEHGPYTASHVTAFGSAPEPVRKAIIPLRDAYEARWNGLLGELRDQGALKPGTDLAFTRLALMGAMNFSIEWFDIGRGSLDDFADAITQQFFNGIGA